MSMFTSDNYRALRVLLDESEQNLQLIINNWAAHHPGEDLPEGLVEAVSEYNKNLLELKRLEKRILLWCGWPDTVHIYPEEDFVEFFCTCLDQLNRDL